MNFNGSPFYSIADLMKSQEEFWRRETDFLNSRKKPAVSYPKVQCKYCPAKRDNDEQMKRHVRASH